MILSKCKKKKSHTSLHHDSLERVLNIHFKSILLGEANETPHLSRQPVPMFFPSFYLKKEVDGSLKLS